jgi:DNA-binding transcriptional ArsR family regulator
MIEPAVAHIPALTQEMRARESIAELFRTLSNPPRIAMLELLLEYGMPSGIEVLDALAERGYPLAQPTIAYHLGRLEALGLVRGEKATGKYALQRVFRPLPRVRRGVARRCPCSPC